MSITMPVSWHSRRAVVAALSLMIVVNQSARAGDDPAFCGLGDLPGGIVFSEANAISPDGRVVVGASRSSNGTEAFAWMASVGIQSLGDLAGGGFFSRAFAVSADKRVIVGESLSASGLEAFAWTAAQGMVGLGDLPDGDFESGATGVSFDGRRIVGTGMVANGLRQTFRWTAAEGMVRLVEDEEAFVSEANGLSENGSVVVGQALIDSSFQAFQWTSTGGLSGLGDLPGGNTSGIARAVSASGAVVVGDSDSDLGTEAFRWTAAEGMTGLGDLPGGLFFSIARAVSADGSVVVGSGLHGEDLQAFIWDRLNGMRNLRDVIESETGADLTGWTLTAATGVSVDGSVIVGNGMNPDGRSEAWIARLRCSVGLMAGNVNTGDGSAPAPVFTVDGNAGDACGVVFVAAGVPVSIGILNPPSVTGPGHYALWICDGMPPRGGAEEIVFQSIEGMLFPLGLGPRCLPVNNTVTPGDCPCPLTFPVGQTSKPLGANRAARLCLNARPAFPRPPTAFMQAFPPGDFTLGGLVLDNNAPTSPQKNASIGNWIVIRSR